MRQKLLTILPLMTLLALTGCVNREQADAKLARACAAAVNTILYEGQRIDEVRDSTSTPSPEGPDFRHITIHTIMGDGWLETENDYECIFQEGFGFLNSNYTASIYQVRTPERTIGKAGDEIMGSAQDFIDLTNAVREALYE